MVDAQLDRLFGRVFNSPLYKGVEEVIYEGFDHRKFFASTMYDDMKALLSSGVTVENLPEPIKTFCEVADLSIEAVKEIDVGDRTFPTELDRDLYYYYALRKVIPEELKRIDAAGFAEYVNQQRHRPLTADS